METILCFLAMFVYFGLRAVVYYATRFARRLL